MTYTLVGPDGVRYPSETKGTLGGHARTKVYGRLDCPRGVRNAADGHTEHRVFFADEATARAAGYRPCGTCMRPEYLAWKADHPAERR
jgi:methylphosphotriester-DNA--protein-cysteine methyltransferase